jgi:flagellar L-ring protein precursor FlgH
MARSLFSIAPHLESAPPDLGIQHLEIRHRGFRRRGDDRPEARSLAEGAGARRHPLARIAQMYGAIRDRIRLSPDARSAVRIIPGILAVATLLNGCSAFDRLVNIGEQPKLTAIDNPTTKAGYKPVQMPMPTPQPATYNPNSLWRNGSRAFFKDQRAHQVGDILTVTVNINDTAQFANETQRSRKNNTDANVTSFFGKNSFPMGNVPVPGALLNADSNASSDGKGTINRTDALTTNVAAVVTQILPNGNMVVEGKQEIRVNFEMRELVVAGIVRPEDIQSDNTIDSTKIAEARIAYGGKGQIMDIQQERYGQQLSDILLPF